MSDEREQVRDETTSTTAESDIYEGEKCADVVASPAEN